jgi:type II secretory pathway component PulF
MQPKVFDSLDQLDEWSENNANEIARHILKAWREIIEEGTEQIVIVKAQPEEYHEDMNIIVEKGEEKEALETLLQEAIDREDYELAREITDLQEKVDSKED